MPRSALLPVNRSVAVSSVMLPGATKLLVLRETLLLHCRTRRLQTLATTWLEIVPGLRLKFVKCAYILQSTFPLLSPL